MIGESYKQQCPTCEAMVLIKSAGLVGKKMECPKCKDHFVVAKPVMSKSAGDSAEMVAAQPSAKPKPTSPAKPAPVPAKKDQAKPKGEESYDVEDDKTSALPAKGKLGFAAKNGPVKTKAEAASVNKKAPAKPAADDDEYEEFVKPSAPVKKAPAKPAAADEEEDEELALTPVKPPTPMKKAPPKAADEEEEIAEAEPDEAEEIAEAEPEEEETPKPAKNPKVKAKPAAVTPKPGKNPKVKPNPTEGQEEAAEAKEATEEAASAEAPAAEQPKKKKFSFKFNLQALKGLKPTSKKTAIGAGLAVVGILVLGTAGYLMVFSGGGNSTPQPPIKLPGPGPNTTKIAAVPIKGKDGKKETDPKPSKVDPKTPPNEKAKPKEPLPELPASLADLSNLLPAESEQVVRFNFPSLLDPNGLFYEAAFKAFDQPGPFNEEMLEKKLGFSPLKVDELIQAERFSGSPWSFTVVHVTENLDLDKLIAAFNLQYVKDGELKIVKKAPGKDAKEKAPKDAKEKASKDAQEKASKDAQEKAPILNVDYYKVGGSPWLEQLGRLALGVPPAIRRLTPQRQPATPLYLHLRDQKTLIVADKKQLLAYLQDQIDMPAEKPVPTDKSATFTKLNPSLKNMLTRLQPTDVRDEMLLVSATLMPGAEVKRSKQQGDLILYRPRPFWDITDVMEETHSRLSVMGITLLAQGKQPTQNYYYRTDLTCISSDHARDLTKELEKGPLVQITGLLEQFLKVKFETPKSEVKIKSASRAGVSQNGLTVKFELKLNLDRQGSEKPARNALEYLALLLTDVHAELAFFEESNLLHQLGKAGKEMVEATEANWRKQAGRLPVGQYPPGAFPLTLKGGVKVHDPGQRISWMAALLPYMGQQGLYDKIQFGSPWQDPLNGPAGQTLVPQFINPKYPLSSRYVDNPDFPAPYAATHFVGIAGVGLDAADPVLGTRRGILGYENSASIEEVQSGRGLSNAMLMIQVPHDSLSGFAPWIGGGGGTLRGVPETNSVDPFIAKDESGTFAIMADGSVRFVTRKIGDKVFQSMSTYQEGGYSIEANPNAKLVPDPRTKKEKAEK